MIIFQCHVSFQGTLPKTNTSIAPEKMASQKQSSLPTIDDQKLAVSFRECKLVQSVGVVFFLQKNMVFLCHFVGRLGRSIRPNYFLLRVDIPPRSGVVVFRGFLA